MNKGNLIYFINIFGMMFLIGKFNHWTQWLGWILYAISIVLLTMKYNK